MQASPGSPAPPAPRSVLGPLFLTQLCLCLRCIQHDGYRGYRIGIGPPWLLGTHDPSSKLSFSCDKTCSVVLTFLCHAGCTALRRPRPASASRRPASPPRPRCWGRTRPSTATTTPSSTPSERGVQCSLSGGRGSQGSVNVKQVSSWCEQQAGRQRGGQIISQTLLRRTRSVCVSAAMGTGGIPYFL